MYGIVGAGGSIANNLTEILVNNNEPVRLISRSGYKSESCETFIADALIKDQLKVSLQGCSKAALLIGIQYKLSEWQKKWPVIMQNMIDVCAELDIPFIFFDNVYMYGLVEGEMTEETPYSPCSQKGEVRANIAKMLLDAIQAGKVKASIARSADFYGPHSEKLSFFHAMVIKNLMDGKAAQWMLDSGLPHTLTFTKDAAMGVYMLSKDDTTWNQTWHLPSATPALTGKQFIELSASILKVEPKMMVLKKWFLTILGLFIPPIKENQEMLYQMSKPYIFSSEKFEKHFNFKPTSYEEGLKLSILHAKSMNNT